MTEQSFTLSSYLARAGRALVETSATHTGSVAGLTRGQVRDFERGRIDLTGEQRLALQRALEELGAVFLADDENVGAGSGVGVRLKFSAEKARRIDTWEGEGGPAYEDDV